MVTNQEFEIIKSIHTKLTINGFENSTEKYGYNKFLVYIYTDGKILNPQYRKIIKEEINGSNIKVLCILMKRKSPGAVPSFNVHDYLWNIEYNERAMQ